MGGKWWQNIECYSWSRSAASKVWCLVFFLNVWVFFVCRLVCLMVVLQWKWVPCCIDGLYGECESCLLVMVATVVFEEAWCQGKAIRGKLQRGRRHEERERYVLLPNWWNCIILILMCFTVVLLNSWGKMPLCWIFVPSLEHTLPLCYELQVGCVKFSVRSLRFVQRKWRYNLNIS
jgi:hypothetical protein